MQVSRVGAVPSKRLLRKLVVPRGEVGLAVADPKPLVQLKGVSGRIKQHFKDENHSSWPCAPLQLLRSPRRLREEKKKKKEFLALGTHKKPFAMDQPSLQIW